MKVVFVFALLFAAAAVAHAEESSDVEDLINTVTDDKTKAALEALNGRVKELEEQVFRLAVEKDKGDDEEKEEEDSGPDFVKVLDGDNFDAAIEEADLTLVEFYAPWCGHCKALAPEYKKAAAELEGADAGVLAKVDCIAHEKLCSKFEVQGFPTIKLFRKGGAKPSDYEGGRTADDLVSFMKKNSGPAVTKVDSVDALKELVGEGTGVVAFLTEADADNLAKFTQVAEGLRTQYTFIAATDAKIAAEYKATAPSVVLLRDFDEPATFSGDLASETLAADLEKFIKVESFPVLGEIGVENYQQYFNRGLNFAWVFLDLSTDEAKAESEKLADAAVIPVAQENREKFSFVKLDGVKWKEHAENLGLTKPTPGFIIENQEDHRNYIFPQDQEITKEALAKFVADFLAGNLKPHVKSEEAPESNDGPVTVIVGTTFDDIVLGDKDVLVEFYAPWCGHCKALAPTYEELGEAYQGDDNVVIAKIDATANDSPADVQGFPTLIFYPAGSKEGVNYEGGRDLDSLKKFIEENRKSAAAAGGAKEEL